MKFGNSLEYLRASASLGRAWKFGERKPKKIASLACSVSPKASGRIPGKITRDRCFGWPIALKW